MVINMKRSIKNTIMIGMAAVLIGTGTITYAYANSCAGANAPQTQMGQQMPDFKNDGGMNRFDNDNKNGGGKQMQPPQQNENDNNKQAPQQNGDNQNTPPQQNGEQSSQTSPSLPQNENNTNSNEQNAESSEGNSANNSNTSAESADAEFEALASNLNQNGMKERKGFNGKVKSFLCYAFLAVQLAIFLLILIYLILSKFNKLSFNQVFPEKQKQQIIS